MIIAFNNESKRELWNIKHVISNESREHGKTFFEEAVCVCVGGLRM